MIHPRHFQFSNAEIAEMDEFHTQLRELSDFLWTDPRPHAEGKFEMKEIAYGWSSKHDDALAALSECGTAACACGWEVLRSGDRMLFDRAYHYVGPRCCDWMFGAAWSDTDNTPFGASYRIDHFLKYRKPWLYSGFADTDIERHYPPNPFWLEAAA